MFSHRREAVNFTNKTNLDWKGIKVNYLFVLLKSQYFKTKRSQYIVKEKNIVKINVNAVESD
jgi:hypothetical protein